MRIIAGRFKGRRLHPPTWEGLRPTSDKLRETLFNVLAPRIDGARVLDGYAGTGAVGLEALSRGARHILFVDDDRRATQLIQKNAAACGVGQDYTIECGDVMTVLRSRGPGTAFDLILLDPPYSIPNVHQVLETAAAYLAPGGLIVLERATRDELDVPPSLERVRDVKSGDSTLSLLQRAASADAEPERR
jgi:16S rRNA (guanine(966)-N(2))-methyltransferase RsmD